MSSLLVGHGRECITPPVGAYMMGYGARTQPSEGVHDDLFANAVALSQGPDKALILALDVCSLDLDGIAIIKGAIYDLTGLEAEQVLINTSHTHAGPSVVRGGGLPFEARYFGTLVMRCAQAAMDALDDLSPASLQVGRASVDIGANRRQRDEQGNIILGVNPDGARLPEVTVWFLQRSAGVSVVLWSLPIHGTTVGERNLQFSSEWMGAAVRRIETPHALYRAVFLQGCAGDQNPYRYERSFRLVDEHGQKVAHAIWEALLHCQPVADEPLRYIMREVTLPLVGGDTLSCPLHALRIGEAVLVGLGGESFVEYALYGRRHSALASTLVLGYTDGSVGYLPTAAAFAEGGYEPNAYKWVPGRKPLHPAVEKVLKAEIDAVLAELGARSPEEE